MGILLATVGVSGTTGAMRFTFENENLMSGIALIPMVIGLLCLPEVIHQACSGIRKTFEQQFDLSGENARDWIHADAIMDQTIRMEQLDCLLSHLLS